MKIKNIILWILSIVTVILVIYAAILRKEYFEAARENFILKRQIYSKSDSLSTLRTELKKLREKAGD
jgi:hypothetical protein